MFCFRFVFGPFYSGFFSVAISIQIFFFIVGLRYNRFPIKTANTNSRYRAAGYRVTAATVRSGTQAILARYYPSDELILCFFMVSNFACVLYVYLFSVCVLFSMCFLFSLLLPIYISERLRTITIGKSCPNKP